MEIELRNAERVSKMDGGSTACGNTAEGIPGRAEV